MATVTPLGVAMHRLTATTMTMLRLTVTPRPTVMLQQARTGAATGVTGMVWDIGATASPGLDTADTGPDTSARDTADWVNESGHDDWGGRCHLLRGARRCDGGDDDYARLAFQELEGERCKALVVASRPTHIEHVIASFGKAVLVHAFLKSVDEKCARLCRAAAQHSNNYRLKLPTRHPRPRCRTAKKGNELAPLQVTELHIAAASQGNL